VVGMLVGGNVAEGNRVVGGALDLAAGEAPVLNRKTSKPSSNDQC
jgi:hypothetical protein